MRRTLLLLFLVASISIFAKVSIGIYGFENNSLLNKIAESYLSKKENVVVIDRENIDLIISEKKLELLGIVENDKNAGEFIELANVNYLFIGKKIKDSAYIKIVDKQGKVIYSSVLKGNIEKALRKELSSIEFVLVNSKIVNIIKKDVIDTFQNTKYISFKGAIAFFEPLIGSDIGYYIFDDIALGISGELNVIGYPSSRWNIEGYAKYNLNRFYSKLSFGYHNDVYNIGNTVYYISLTPGYELNNFNLEIPMKIGYNLGQIIFDPGLNLLITIKF